MDNEHITIQIPFPTSDNPRFAAQQKIDQLVIFASGLFDILEFVATSHEREEISEPFMMETIHTAAQIGSAAVETIQSVYMEYGIFREE